MNKGKEFFFKYSGWLSKSNSLPKLINKSGIKIIFPFYHVVSDESLPHIKNLYSYPTINKFKTDLDFILKYFEPMHPDELEDQGSIKKNKFLLTFDDGLREMHEIVAPVLKQKGVPALFFINSGFTDNKNLFFRYKVSVLIEELKPGRKEKKHLLNLKYEDIPHIDKIAALKEVDFNAYLENKKPYLSTEQIRSMHADGFVFGAHSIDHPRYSEIHLLEQIHQTNESVNFVRSITGQQKNYFAFPFTDDGVEKYFFSRLAEINGIGLKGIFGTAGLQKKVDNLIQRIPMEIDEYSAEEIIKREYGWYLIKNMFGR